MRPVFYFRDSLLLAALLLFFARTLPAAVLTVQTNKIGTTPESIAYNSGHFVPGSNTDDWWHYSGVTGARVFITPDLIEPNDDLAPYGDGVTSPETFVSRKNALRANPLNPSYINWSYVTPKFGNTSLHGSNYINPNHACSRLHSLGIKILVSLTASPGQFPIADTNDWGGRWELWQHFYLEAFYLAREFDVERFQMYNEPDLDGIDLATNYFPRLQIASDAVQSAVADVDRIYGKALTARMLAPVTAGTASGDYSTWGKMIVTNRHLTFLGQTDTNFSVIGQYDYHQYNSTPANFGGDISILHNNLTVDMAPEPRYRTSISEFNVHTASTFYTLTETLDSPSKYSRFGSIVVNLANNSCNELYCFKLSQTMYNSTIPVKKNGMHFVDNTNSPYNIGGITKAGEVYRLFNKAAAPNRDRLSVTKGTGATTLDVTATYDSALKRYHLFSANNTSTDIDLTLNLAALNLPANQYVLLEEVSENIYGGGKSRLVVSNSQVVAGTQSSNTVWMFSMPTVAQEPAQSLLAAENAMVMDGSAKNINFPVNAGLLVENNPTNTNERSAAYFKFHLPTIYVPDIQFAVLSVRATSLNSNIDAVHVFGLTNQNWSQTNITWANAPGLKQNVPAGSDYTNNFVSGQGTLAQVVGQFVAGPTAQDVMIDVTKFVREHPTNNLSFFAVREVNFQGDIQNPNGLSILTKEASASNGPRLILVRSKDSDGDGISDDSEINVFGTNPNNPDTDGDGKNDGDEILILGTNPKGSPPAPAILQQPAGSTVAVGESATFTVVAEGSDPLLYQWFFNDTNSLVGATNSTLTLTNLSLAQSGDYRVTVSNALGFATSSNAFLSVTNVSSPPEPQVDQLIYEPFSYAVGSNLTGQNGWLLNSGTSGTIESGNLSIPGLLSAQGNRFTWSNTSMSMRLPLGTNMTSGEVYFSFALRAEAIGSFTAEGTLAGLTTGTGTSFGAKINIRPDGAGGYQLGISKGSGSTFGSWVAANYSANETIFVVSRYIFHSGASTDDLCDLWLNPDSSTFGATNPPAATLASQGTGGSDLPQIDRFFFRSGSSSSSPAKLTTDELRVGQTWASVTEPAPVLLGFTLNGSTATLTWPRDPAGFILEQANDFPASWVPVTNAVSVNGDQNGVTLSPTFGARFYRLKK